MSNISEKKYTCIVCGKKFSEGQGIIIKVRGIILTFHKKSCFVKFFKNYVDIVDPECFEKYAKRLVAEYEELIKKKTIHKRFLEEE